MKAFGSTIEVRMKLAGLPASALSRSGPVVPVALAAFSVWHPEQPWLVKSWAPSAVDAPVVVVPPAGAVVVPEGAVVVPAGVVVPRLCAYWASASCALAAASALCSRSPDWEASITANVVVPPTRTANQAITPASTADELGKLGRLRPRIEKPSAEATRMPPSM